MSINAARSSMASSLVLTAFSAADTAAQLSSVPGLAIATGILTQIATTCDQISVNKSDCKQLANKCAQLLIAYNDQASRLEGSELLQSLDQVTNALESVLSKVRTWASYSYAASFLRKSKIESGLAKCTAQIDNVMKTFDINSQGIMHESQKNMTETMAGNYQSLMEMLERIRTDQEKFAMVVEHQRQGDPIAVSLMQTGQNELRVMRTRFAEEPSENNPSSSAARQKYSQFEETLLSLHRATGIPPSIKRLDGEIKRDGDIPFAGGLYCDVWLGTWLSGEKVALKALRGVKAREKVRERFEREIEFWAKLSHPNILPLYGIVTNIGQQIHMVSPWQSNGNLLEYVKRTPDANQCALFRSSSAGLSYLHSRHVIHGNVKCTNVLISSDEEAKICDFGMSKIMEEVTDISASKSLTTNEGSARYVAPELIEANEASTTMASDTYSFAMLILECVTQKAPFANLKRDAAVIHAIVNKKQCPARPENPEAQRWITDELWELMKRCWSTAPSARPTMEEVHTFFVNLVV